MKFLAWPMVGGGVIWSGLLKQGFASYLGGRLRQTKVGFS